MVSNGQLLVLLEDRFILGPGIEDLPSRREALAKQIEMVEKCLEVLEMLSHQEMF